MQGFRSIKALQKCAAVHVALYNHFNLEHQLVTHPIYKLRPVAAQLTWGNIAG